MLYKQNKFLFWTESQRVICVRFIYILFKFLPHRNICKIPLMYNRLRIFYDIIFWIIWEKISSNCLTIMLEFLVQKYYELVREQKLFPFKKMYHKFLRKQVYSLLPRVFYSILIVLISLFHICFPQMKFQNCKNFYRMLIKQTPNIEGHLIRNYR